MDVLAAGFKALADPTRLRLLGLLLCGELCVCSLMAALDLPQSTVSRHLGVLRAGGWVAGRRSGKWMYYRLAEPDLLVLQGLLALLREHFASDATARRDADRLAERLRRRLDACCGL